MNAPLLLQQCPACLVRRTWMILEMGGGGCIAAALWDVASWN